MKKFLVFILYLVYRTMATEDVIYELDDESFHRMPPKYHLDRFQQCLSQPGGMYCTTWADLVSDQPSDLLHSIQAYSAHYTKHFNYSNIRYGLCLTRSCRQFYAGDTSQPALWNSSEACLNDSLSREYDLKALVTDIDCYGHDHKFEINYVDIAIVSVLGLILALNVAGSVYHFYVGDQANPNNQFLMSFSIFGNWKRLVAPPSSDSLQARFRGLNGLKSLTSILVVLGHIPMPTINAIINPDAYEKTYRIVPQHILHNGHVVPLTFFTMSGFLLAFSLEAQAEKQPLSSRQIPLTLFARWMRLTPANLVTLMLTAVWYKFITIGPLFKEFIVQEATDCRKYWLYNLFYATNTINHSQCNLQVWFLASDMQLHIICLAVVILAPSKRVRNWALGVLFLISVAYPAYLVYTHDLDGNYLSTPSVINKFCTAFDTFNMIFKPAIPNMGSFVMGMGLGYIVYDMHKKNLLECNYRKYRLWYWLSVTSMFLVVMTGYIFFLDTPKPPMLVRVLYTPIVKPLFTLCVNLIILGTICRCDELVRGILEWSGWTPIMRISYCMYLMHMTVLRYTAGTRDGLYYMSPVHVMQEYFGTLSMTIIYAALLHLLVEAPFGNLLKSYLLAKPTKKQVYDSPAQDKHTTKIE